MLYKYKFSNLKRDEVSEVKKHRCIHIGSLYANLYCIQK